MICYDMLDGVNTILYSIVVQKCCITPPYMMYCTGNAMRLRERVCMYVCMYWMTTNIESDTVVG